MSNNLQGINLYLIGMMGAGKTTVGKLLAQHLGYGFLDTDEVIVKVAGKSINTIFAEAGESTFRQLESKVLSEVCAYTKLAIATGGGIVMNSNNWSYLHHGLIVWLDVPVELLYKRLLNDTIRPLLQDPEPQEKLLSLLEQREPLYAQADLGIRVREGETPQEIAARIVETIPSVLKSNERKE
ncbi:MAG: shikimate kinase [Richelia sp.]|nr:shikimate kinase [Richelia sp.]